MRGPGTYMPSPVALEKPKSKVHQAVLAEGCGSNIAKIGTQNGSLVDGTKDENLRSNSRWLDFDPYPHGIPGKPNPHWSTPTPRPCHRTFSLRSEPCEEEGPPGRVGGLKHDAGANCAQLSGHEAAWN